MQLFLSVYTYRLHVNDKNAEHKHIVLKMLKCTILKTLPFYLLYKVVKHTFAEAEAIRRYDTRQYVFDRKCLRVNGALLTVYYTTGLIITPPHTYGRPNATKIVYSEDYMVLCVFGIAA